MTAAIVTPTTRPVRASGEPIESWLRRVVEWEETTPEGRDEKAKRIAYESRKGEEELARHRKAESDAIGIPERYRFLQTTDPIATEAIEAVRDYSGLLVLSGQAGCGKTAAACWWLYRQPPGKGRGVFITASAMAQVSQFDAEANGRLRRAPRLVIDDLGMEYSDTKGYFSSLFDSLVNERYANCLPMVMTTNLGVDAFRARYGERIADRIREDGRFVSCANASLRKRV